MYATYEEYISLGYSTVGKEDFQRFLRIAECKVRKRTFNRVTDNNISEINKCGVCEIVDLYYNDSVEEKRPIISFSNSKYSETYDKPKTLDQKICDVMDLFFTPDQKWRGY